MKSKKLRKYAYANADVDKNEDENENVYAETKTKAEKFFNYLILRLFWLLTGIAFGYLWAYKALL